MKNIFWYVTDYFRSVQAVHFLYGSVFIALAIFCNYYFGVNAHINALPGVTQYTSWFLIFFCAFFVGYIVQAWPPKKQFFQNPIFLFFLFLAPALFAWKMMAHFDFSFTASDVENNYWNRVIYWPLKCVVVLAILLLIWKRFDTAQPFYGTAIKNFNVQPYLIMLLCMLPLLALAATQRDFLAVYPKLQNSVFLSGNGAWYYKLLYELSYGIDFFTIELFFRGFLILGFAKWAGKKAVLPMALFYCTIHFGKPLGECISSYFGGLILGAITLQTRTIWGGLIVHLGIAWLMEAFGYLGHSFIK